MARPRLYTVHLRAWSAEADRDAVFVREGFAWSAFLFSVVWALWHRLWVPAVLIAGALAALALADDLLELNPLIAHAASLGLSLLVGFEANDWRREALRRRGYAEAGLVAAANLAEAEHRFFATRRGGAAA
jgi:hypothetical protein